VHENNKNCANFPWIYFFNFPETNTCISKNFKRFCSLNQMSYDHSKAHIFQNCCYYCCFVLLQSNVSALFSITYCSFLYFYVNFFSSSCVLYGLFSVFSILLELLDFFLVSSLSSESESESLESSLESLPRFASSFGTTATFGCDFKCSLNSSLEKKNQSIRINNENYLTCRKMRHTKLHI